MTPPMIAYTALGIAIILEVIGSSFLQRSAQFTRIGPTLIMSLCYVSSFYALSQALKVLPLGVAYAIWSGLGIVLTASVSVVVFRQTLDLAAMLGMGLIVAGVMVMNVFSRTTGH